MKTSFLESSDWIWLESAPKENCYAEFRHVFKIDSEESMQLSISAEGQYAVYLNETYIPSTQYTDYPFYKSVQKVELFPSPEKEEQELVIQVLFPGIDTAISMEGIPGLHFELYQKEKLLCVSGEQTQARLMSQYVSGSVEWLTPQLGSGFIFRRRDEFPWGQACLTEKECEMIEKPIRELRVGEKERAKLISQGIFRAHESGLQQYAELGFRELDSLVAPAGLEAIRANGDGRYILPCEKGVSFSTAEGDGIYLLFDLEEETVGYLDLDLICPVSTRVDISYGEHLEDLRVRSDVGGRHFTFQWEAPCVREEFIHRFHRIGARYLQIFIYGTEVLLYYAGIIPVEYPFRQEAQLFCSDHLYNRILEVSKHTLRCCVHQHYEDCPWREQALYGFDSRNQMLFGYYAFGEFEQPKANLRLLALSQREDGLLELCPTGKTQVNIPSFSLMFLVELEEYCRYSGDITFAREMLPQAERILSVFREHFRDGLMWNFPETAYWNFYEWSPLLDGDQIKRTEELELSAEAPLQLLYILALQRVCRIYEYLSMDTWNLQQEVHMLQTGMEKFWNQEKEAYASFIRDGKQLQEAEFVQALALYTGSVPKKRQQMLRQKICQQEFLPSTMAASIFSYEALLQEPEIYGTAVFEKVAQRWGKMLYSGATTFWETDDGAQAFDRAGSLCHAWSCIPIYLFGAYVLGVRPEQPGIWKKYTGISSGIYNAKGILYTPHGVLEV